MNSIQVVDISDIFKAYCVDEDASFTFVLTLKYWRLISAPYVRIKITVLTSQV